MSFSKIAQIALYIVAGISLLVIAFFYFGDNLIDVDAYQAKVDKLNTPEMTTYTTVQAQEDSTAVANDTTAVMSTTAEENADAIPGEMESSEENVEGTSMEAEEPAVEEVAEPVEEEEITFTFMERLVNKKTDIALGWSYILVIATLIVALVFSVAQMFGNTRALIRGLILLVGVAVVVGIAYMLGSDTPLEIFGYEGTDNSDPGVLKMVDTGLLMTYFIIGGILVTILYSEIAKYFK